MGSGRFLGAAPALAAVALGSAPALACGPSREETVLLLMLPVVFLVLHIGGILAGRSVAARYAQGWVRALVVLANAPMVGGVLLLSMKLIQKGLIPAGVAMLVVEGLLVMPLLRGVVQPAAPAGTAVN